MSEFKKSIVIGICCWPCDQCHMVSMLVLCAFFGCVCHAEAMRWLGLLRGVRSWLYPSHSLPVIVKDTMCANAIAVIALCCLLLWCFGNILTYCSIGRSHLSRDVQHDDRSWMYARSVYSIGPAQLLLGFRLTQLFSIRFYLEITHTYLAEKHLDLSDESISVTRVSAHDQKHVQLFFFNLLGPQPHLMSCLYATASSSREIMAEQPSCRRCRSTFSHMEGMCKSMIVSFRLCKKRGIIADVLSYLGRIYKKKQPK